MLVSIVIPSFNGKAHLGRCLESVEAACAQMPQDEVETIVVDDASTDATAAYLQERWPAVRVVRLSRNMGFAAAVNQGARAARGEWIAVLNNDTVVDERWLSAARLDRRPDDVGAVASRIMTLTEPAVIESSGDGYTAGGLAYQRHSGRPAAAGSGARRVFSACAAAAFYRRTVYLEAGGFDETFECYYEDVDLGFRMNLAGYRTLYEPGSFCYHLGAGSHGHRSWRRLKNSARNSELVFFSCMPGALLVSCLPAHAAAVLMQAALRVFRGGLLPFIAGKAAFLAMLPQVLRRRRRIQDGAKKKCSDIRSHLDNKWLMAHAGSLWNRRGREPAPRIQTNA